MSVLKGMYPKKGRVILHIDVNAFYASVEEARNPALKGKPMAIAGNPKERRGIVVTCNYAARNKGIYAPMPLWEAKKIFPQLIVLKPDFTLYRKVSAQMFSYLSTISSILEPASIDEGYLDITDCFHQGTPLEIAQRIQNDLLNELQIPVSIGIAPNKFLAKTASNMKKPLGITILRKRDIHQKLWPHPVVYMHGIGNKTAEKLNAVHIHTIEELAHADDHKLKATVGVRGVEMKQRANGIDNRPVNPNRRSEFKSIGHSKTLAKNMTDDREMVPILNDLAESVSKRMHAKKVVSKTIQLTIRYSNFKTITRTQTIDQWTNQSKVLLHWVNKLLQKHWNGEPVRLLGVAALQVERMNDRNQEQLSLFTYERHVKDEPLYKAVQQLQSKYGDEIIRKGLKK